MRSLQGLTLGVIALALVLAASATAVAPVTTTNTYVVSGSTMPGVSTGLVLDGDTATVTATGAVCARGNGFCPGPNGDATYNTTTSPYGGFPAPGAPAWGLVARVGGGPWLHVGSGPTSITGTGVLEFAVNDDLLRDNTGSFTVTVAVTYSDSSSCKPGWGWGDKNHDHCGPPGLADKPTSETGSSGNGNGNANGHAKR